MCVVQEVASGRCIRSKILWYVVTHNMRLLLEEWWLWSHLIRGLHFLIIIKKLDYGWGKIKSCLKKYDKSILDLWTWVKWCFLWLGMVRWLLDYGCVECWYNWNWVNSFIRCRVGVSNHTSYFVWQEMEVRHRSTWPASKTKTSLPRSIFPRRAPSISKGKAPSFPNFILPILSIWLKVFRKAK